jgi:two-component system sensor histidine kinase FlrB
MNNTEELRTLKETFKDFIKSSRELEKSYDILKNESTLLSIYLANILENLDRAILVFDNQYNLKISNHRAKYYFPSLSCNELPLPFKTLSTDCLFNSQVILEQTNFLKQIKIQNKVSTEWIEIIKSPFLDNGRNQIGFLIMISDITEFNKMQKKLRTEDRLRVMGELAAEVAHEIRNPLGSIELMTSLLRDNVSEKPANIELIDRIRNSVNNMNHIVTNILLYTRDLIVKRTKFGAEQLIDDSISLIWDSIVKQNIVIEKKLEAIEISADFELLKQALANIIKNSCQSLGKNGKIEIQAKMENNFFEISIRDYGKGISQNLIDKIFKPFFTTKNTGTGLGLAMVRRVIEAHNGQIKYISNQETTDCLIKLPQTMEK